MRNLGPTDLSLALVQEVLGLLEQADREHLLSDAAGGVAIGEADHQRAHCHIQVDSEHRIHGCGEGPGHKSACMLDSAARHDGDRELIDEDAPRAA